MSDFKTRKQYRIQARKYQELLKNITGLAFRIEQEFCICNKAYIDRGLVDPNCQSHDIAEFVSDVIIGRHLTSGSTATAFGVDYAAPVAKDRSVKTLVKNKNGGA